MNVLFVNYHDFTSNSAIHIFHLANRLDELGESAKVCVPDHTDSVGAIGVPRFSAVSFEDARQAKSGFRDWRPDIIHAWTPRELVRRVTVDLVAQHHCPYVVHLEDNEEQILADNLGVTVADLTTMPSRVLDRRVPQQLTHPRRYRDFLAASGGVTALIDRLLEFKPKHVPGEVFWPAFDEDLPWSAPIDYAARRSLGIADTDFVLVYNGNVHHSNRGEVLSLYLAVGLLNRRGISAKLVRTGVETERVVDSTLGELRRHCIDLGYRPRQELPRILGMADALVQPGAPGRFNDYRFPSKLPEFLATARPVVLPKTNIGRHLEDGKNCLLLEEGHALEIAQKLETLAENAELRKRIGAGGRAFAEENLSWRKSAQQIRKFYDDVLAATVPAKLQNSIATLRSIRGQEPQAPITSGGASDGLDRLLPRYSRFAVERLGYATVRDYCDSMDHLRGLATANGDLKDVQRPWMLKAILGTVPMGGSLLEVGAGEPLVAEMLRKLGYKVTVIDAYEGLGNGPREFEAFVRRYPELKFVRAYLSESVPQLPPGTFDCIYSISVLEHIPAVDLPGVFAGIRRFLRPRTGQTIHAIDHVLLGPGDADHLQRLSIMMDELGIAREDLEALLTKLSNDAETYFLAASGHNLWRGGLPYDDFPMRRCVSVHVRQSSGQILASRSKAPVG